MVRRIIACCAVMASPALAEPLDGEPAEELWEISGFAKNETALFASHGPVIGQPASTLDKSGHGTGNLLKQENTLALFINGQFSEETRLHTQLNLVYDSQGVTDDERGHRSHSQHDFLREMYLDKSFGDLRLRLGKQQVVWGKADGIKLLDIINPTDFREFVQNTQEESRIPVLMANAELPVASGNLQLLLIQRKSNRVPGLDGDGEAGHPFIMKGVDAITGPVNGFRNITPALGAVANTFHRDAQGGGAPGLNIFTTSTVQEYVNNQVSAFNGGGANPTSAATLDNKAQTTNQNTTRLTRGAYWNQGQPGSAFEYMNDATFATFNTFVNAKATYRKEEPDAFSPNLGMRYKDKLGRSFRYTLNYLYHYDANPAVDLHWESAAGDPLSVETTRVTGTGAADPSGNANRANKTYTTVRLKDAAGRYYGAVDPNTGAAINRPATLVFTERTNRIHSLGGSFDTTQDTRLLGPVVWRGELLYQFDTNTPVVDRTRLSYGDLAGGLSNVKADQFKYVLGADVTTLTNLLVSGQFIQFINLDYIDEAGDGSANSGRATADAATMHLGNGLQKGSEFKEMLSVYFSKPFGEAQRGRIDNLTIYEERGGYWNRLSPQWSFTDQWLGTAEWNQYWGNENTLFGQFDKSSNVQMGLKYIF